MAIDGVDVAVKAAVVIAGGFAFITAIINYRRAKKEENFNDEKVAAPATPTIQQQTSGNESPAQAVSHVSGPAIIAGGDVHINTPPPALQPNLEVKQSYLPSRRISPAQADILYAMRRAIDMGTVVFAKSYLNSQWTMIKLSRINGFSFEDEQHERAINALESQGLIYHDGDRVCLTDEGNNCAECVQLLYLAYLHNNNLRLINCTKLESYKVFFISEDRHRRLTLSGQHYRTCIEELADDDYLTLESQRNTGWTYRLHREGRALVNQMALDTLAKLPLPPSVASVGR